MAKKKNTPASRDKKGPAKGAKGSPKAGAKSSPKAAKSSPKAAKSSPKAAKGSPRSAAKGGKGLGRITSAGFDAVDDFFFGSETGKFERDEFDYDPFEDHTATGSGLNPAVDDTVENTRAALPIQKGAAPAAPDQLGAGAAEPSDSDDEVIASVVEETPVEVAAEPEVAEDVVVATGDQPPVQPGVGSGDETAEDAGSEDAGTEDAGADDAGVEAAAVEGAGADDAGSEDAVGLPDDGFEVFEADAFDEEVIEGGEAEATQQMPAPEEGEDASAASQDDSGAGASAEQLEVPLASRRAAGTAQAVSMQHSVEIAGPAGDDSDADMAKPGGTFFSADFLGAKTVAQVAIPKTPLPEPEVRDAWSDAVSVLAAEVDELSGNDSADRRAAYLFEVGRILLNRMGDAAAAEPRFEAAVQASSDFLPALRELVRLCAGREDWSRAVDLLARQSQAEPRSAERAAALLVSAHIQLAQLDRLAEAESDLRNALEDAPDNFIALRFLREIRYRANDWEGLVEVLNQCRKGVGPGEQLRIDNELGRLYDEMIRDPAAAERSFRACLDNDPRYITAFLAVERLVQEGDDSARLVDLWSLIGRAWGGPDLSFWLARAARVADAAALEPEVIDGAYEQAIAGASFPEALSEEYRHSLESRGRFDELDSACRAELEREEGPRARAQLLTTLGRIALQHLGDSTAAAQWFEQALTADPTCVEAQSGRRQGLAAAGDWRGLVAFLEAQVAAAEEPRVQLALILKMAETAGLQGGDLEQAQRHLERAVELSPNYLPALDGLIEILGKQKAYSEQAEKLELAASIVDSGGARACYMLRASRAWARAGDRDRSIKSLQRSSEDGPGSLLAREWLIDAYIDDEQWAEAAETLRQAAAETDDRALKISLLYRSGRLYLARCSDEDAAEAGFRSLLDLVPDFLPATLDLQQIYTSRGDWDSYGLLQQQEAEASPEGSMRQWRHVAAGQAYERAGRMEDALSQYKAALRIDPADSVANGALRRVYRRTGDHANLAESYVAQIQGVHDDPARVDALRLQLIAALSEVGDVAAVAAEVRRLVDSGNPDSVPFAALGIVCDGLQAWDEAILLYGLKGDYKGSELPARAACLFQQGLLTEEIREDPAASAVLYQRAAELSDQAPIVLEALEAIYAGLEDPASLAGVYQQRAESSSLPPVRAFYALLAGEQFEGAGNTASALAAYQFARDDEVGRARAFDPLRRLMLAENDVEGLRSLCTESAAKATGSAAIGCWMELAQDLAALDEWQGAQDALHQVLEFDETFLPALLHLEQVASHLEDWNAVLGALKGIADHAGVESTRQGASSRIEWVLAEKGVTSEGAYDYYTDLHDREPENIVALRGLAGIYHSRGELEPARGFYQQLSERSDDDRLKAEASTHLGLIALEADEDASEATTQLEIALELDATHLPAIEALKQIHGEQENWNSLVGVLAREASRAQEDQRLPLFVEIARLWEEKIGNAKVAISSWNKVLEQDPGHEEARQHLLKLYEAEGDWAGYLDVAETDLESLTGLELRDRQAELGLLAHERGGLPDRAIPYLQAAASGDQPSLPALGVLRTIAREHGDWEQLIALTETQSEVAESTADRVALLVEAARVRLDRLLDRGGAAKLFSRVRELDPDCRDALAFFVDFFFDNERWDEAMTVFPKYEPFLSSLDIEGDDEARIEATEYYFKFGTVLSRSDQNEAALKHFDRALELTPTHLPSLEAAVPLYHAAGDWERTRTACRAMLRLRGGSGDSAALTRLYVRLGQAELELDEVASALKRFKKALDQSPNHVEALEGIARSHWLSEDWNSLLSTYNSIIKYARDPSQVIRAYMTKGDVLENKLQYTDKAVLHYEKVLMYDNTNVGAMARLGQIALRNGDIERARDFATKARDAASSDEDRIHGLLLEKLVSLDESFRVGDLLDSVRQEGGEGSVLDAFASALSGKQQAARAEAIEACGQAFRGF